MTSTMQLFPYLQKRNEKQLQYSYRGFNGCGFLTMYFSHDWLHIRTRFSTPYSDLHFDVPMVHLPTDQYHVKRFNPHDSCFGVRTLHCRLSPPFPSGFGAHPFHHQKSDVLYRTGSDSVLFDQYTKIFRDWNCDARNSKWGWQYDYIHHWCDRTEVIHLKLVSFFNWPRLFFQGQSDLHQVLHEFYQNISPGCDSLHSFALLQHPNLPTIPTHPTSIQPQKE